MQDNNVSSQPPQKRNKLILATSLVAVAVVLFFALFSCAPSMAYADTGEPRTSYVSKQTKVTRVTVRHSYYITRRATNAVTSATGSAKVIRTRTAKTYKAAFRAAYKASRDAAAALANKRAIRNANDKALDMQHKYHPELNGIYKAGEPFERANRRLRESSNDYAYNDGTYIGAYNFAAQYMKSRCIAYCLGWHGIQWFLDNPKVQDEAADAYAKERYGGWANVPWYGGW